jgi:iron-sulfur cluster assembly protein
VDLTFEAVQQLRRVLPEGKALKLGVQGGGCSGLVYLMDEMDPPPDDPGATHQYMFFTDNDERARKILVMVDKKSWLFLQDCTLDYDGGLKGQGFTWSNPKATNTCGCGGSFRA